MIDYLGDDLAAVVDGQKKIEDVMQKALDLGFDVFCDIPFNAFAVEIANHFPQAKVSNLFFELSKIHFSRTA